METTIAYASAALAFWGLWGYFSKLAAVRIDPYCALCYAIISKSLIGIGIATYAPQALSSSTQGAAFLAMGAGLLLMVGTYLQFYAMQDGVGGLVVTITSLYPVVIITLYPALAVLFDVFKQGLSALDGAGISLALTGIYFIAGGDSE